MSWQVETLDPSMPMRRIRLLRSLVIFSTALLLARLWWVQVAAGDLYAQLSEGTRRRHIPLQAPRGRIYDRAGRLLATTLPQFTVVVDPIELRRHPAAERAAIFDRVSHILDIPVSDIQDILSRSRQEGFSAIRLKSGVGPAAITRMLEDAADLPGFDVQRVPIRTYPMGALASHVLGYVGDVTATDLKRSSAYNGADQIGEQGLERAYESDLRGQDGERTIEVNAHGAPVNEGNIARTEPQPGKNLVLTLDSKLQWVAQGAFPPNARGSVVAVDVRTGGILAMASRPGFDPNMFVQDSPDARKQRAAYLLDTAGPMQDRAVMSRYPPGSTFKLVTSAAGFAAGAIDPHKIVFCAEGMKLGGKHGEWKKCWQWHGKVDYRRAMSQSCDTYFYDLMRRLSSTQLAAMCHALGLGEHTGIDLVGDSRGFVPTPAWKDQRFKHERWWFGDACNMAIGQGYVLTTPLQMALVTAAVANGGYVLRPHLVQELRSADNRVLQRTGVHTGPVAPIPPAGLDLIRQGMRSAVADGTAGIVRFKNLDVAGKTGSAQDRRDQPTHAWFVCYAPYDHPQIAICSMVEHGGHGGTTAGPIARAILNAYFHLHEGDVPPSRKTD